VERVQQQTGRTEPLTRPVHALIKIRNSASPRRPAGRLAHLSPQMAPCLLHRTASASVAGTAVWISKPCERTTVIDSVHRRPGPACIISSVCDATDRILYWCSCTSRARLLMMYKTADNVISY